MDTTSALGFTGEFADPSGLLFLRARYYNPDIGRFFQLDPVEGMLMSPETWNRYSYAASNPIQYVDPIGWGPIDPARDYGAPPPPIGLTDLAIQIAEGIANLVLDFLIAQTRIAPLTQPTVQSVTDVCEIETDTADTDSERPIVLDLGPGSNYTEVMTILGYRPFNKVIAIDLHQGHRR